MAHDRRALLRAPAETLRLLAVAVGFLTRLPVPAVTPAEGDLRRASGAFALVGVGVAALGVAVRAGAEPLWGATAATVAAVAATVAVTGALHEDGLADTVDGLWGGADAAQRLAIMRDSRLGVYGALALAGALGLRVALLAPLPLAGFAAAVTVGHVCGRASALPLARWLPPARDDGSGAQVVGAAPRLATAVTALTVAVVLVVAVGWWAPVPLAAGIVVLAGCRRLVRRRLGGSCGDVFGAVNQAVHVASMAVVSALVQAGWL